MLKVGRCKVKTQEKTVAAVDLFTIITFLHHEMKSPFNCCRKKVQGRQKTRRP